MDRPPTPSVIVPDYIDGVFGPPPRRGGSVEYAVVFELLDDAADPLARAYDFVAEPDAVPLATGTGGAAADVSVSCIATRPVPVPAWPVLLRAGLWTADWLTDRPVRGPVRLTGRLRAEPPETLHSDARINGHVSRLRMIRESWHQKDAEGGGWTTDDRCPTTREVATCAPLLGHGPSECGYTFECTGARWSRDVAVLVDIGPRETPN